MVCKASIHVIKIRKHQANVQRETVIIFLKTIEELWVQRRFREIKPTGEANGGETNSEAMVTERGESHLPEQDCLCSDQQKPANTGQICGLACYDVSGGSPKHR